MRTKRIVLAGLLSCVASFPAFSQAPSAPPAQRMETTTTTTTTTRSTGQWRASKLIGVNIYNNDNEKVGDISEVLLDTSGKVTGVVIGVGGFLGIGQHDVLVTMDQLKFVNEPRTTTTTTTAPTGSPPPAPARPARAATEQWYPDHAIINATKDQLKGMPAFKYN
jgi:sporulation protein YlmC with PRC-barrel domain